MNKLTLKSMALAAITGTLAGASGTVLADAEAEALARLKKPESSFSVGFGYLTSDAPLAGQYTGKDDSGFYLLGEVDLVRLDGETGTWLKLRGRDLGLSSREIRLEHERQGDWGYSIELNQIPRYEPYTVTTGLTGIGTTTQTVGGTGLRGVELETERERLTFAVKKYLPAGFDFRLKFVNEEKDGSRMFGQQGFNFLTEPIDSTTRQVDAVLSFTGKKLQLAGGYYGSFFDTRANHVDVISGGFTPMSTPPGNQSHQFYLTGGCNFTPTTRGTLKLAYGHTSQEETFSAPHVGGRPHASAALDTFSAHVGATARPLPKLSLLGNFHYENRDERTPVDLYITGVGGGSRHDGTNVPHSRETASGKFEASYALPRGFRVTAGADYEQRLRSVPDVRAVVYRKKSAETAYRVELQRSLSETINGRVSYTHSKRDGSAFLTNLLNSGAVGSNLINPLHIANRDRDKLRVMLDWLPTEELSLQFMASYSDDEYSGPNAFGPQDGRALHFSVDAAYVFSETWNASAWYSREATEAENTTTTGGVDRLSEVDNTTHAVGLGLKGTFNRGIEFGADVSYTFDRGEFTQIPVTGPALAPLDNVYYRRARFNLYSVYPLRPNSGLRFDLIHDRWNRDDWQWDGFVYADGTTVSQRDNQNDTFVGGSFYYKFW